MDFQQRQAEEAEEQEDLETAFLLWKQLAAKNSEAFFFLRLGSVARELQRWEESEHAFDDALRLDPSSPLIMENIGTLWASRTDVSDVTSFETAKQWFLRALEYGHHPPLLTQLGATYVALGDHSAAKEAFEEAIRIDPEYEEALYNLATLEEKTDPSKSVVLLERAIKIDSNYALAHRALARLYQNIRNPLRAEYHFRRCLEIDPADYWSNIYLANLLGAQGKNEEAEQMFGFATSLHPEITGGLTLFARFLTSIGRKDEAAEVLARMKP